MSRIWEALKHAQLQRRKSPKHGCPDAFEPGPDRRRGKRVEFGVPVWVYGHANAEPFHEETRTVVVNSHGALLSLANRVHVGQRLLLTNRDTREECECRVVYVEPSAHRTVQARIGIELVQPAPEFWRTDGAVWPEPEKRA